MRKGYRKTLITMAALAIAVVSMTGCKPSEKKVKESTYYKELESKYKKAQKENEDLQETIDSNEQISESEQRAENYIAKIGRDTIIRLEVGYADDMDNCDYVSQTEVYDFCNLLAKEMDRTTKYTPETIDESLEKKYGYILYDEDNAIYELTIYEGDYIVFSDLPKYVYYCSDASVLGDAFLPYRVKYPSSNLMHRIADSPIMISSGGNSYGNNVSAELSMAIDQMEKKSSSEKAAREAWEKSYKKKFEEDENYTPTSVAYTFYHHSNTMTLTLYDTYIQIRNINDKVAWYKVTKKDISSLKQIVKQARIEKEAKLAKSNNNESDDSTDKNSHSKEIEEESIISSDE